MANIYNIYHPPAEPSQTSQCIGHIHTHTHKHTHTNKQTNKQTTLGKHIIFIDHVDFMTLTQIVKSMRPHTHTQPTHHPTQHTPQHHTHTHTLYTQRRRRPQGQKRNARQGQGQGRHRSHAVGTD